VRLKRFSGVVVVVVVVAGGGGGWLVEWCGMWGGVVVCHILSCNCNVLTLLFGFGSG
jgi:hypothetical protein